jgi:outer membrane receptor protein involved in Fe transport
VAGGLDPIFENGGRGRIYGMELSARINPDHGEYVGYLSYTLSRSERLDRPDDPDAQWRLFDFDQTHILTLSFTYNLPRNWSLGGTVRIVSGNPSTPIIGSVYDAMNDVYLPIDGRVNSQRNPLFHRLDVRLEKKWIWETFTLAFFIDVQNAYNQANQEGLIYNFDFTETTVINGLPIIPALGIRGEL